jgi:hypothetical protein
MRALIPRLSSKERKEIERELRFQIAKNVKNLSLNLQAIVLWNVHQQLGHGKKRLIEFQRTFLPLIKQLQDFYMAEDEEETEFTDGLIQPQSTETFPLDETGSGIEKKEFFSIDLNNDGVMDRIIRTRNENATAHFWDDYRVELNKKGKFENVSPEGLRTIEGADGSLQKIQFVFKPKFQIIKISRPWIYSWDNPTMATRTVYELQGDKIVEKSVKELKKVYDVSELFGNH